MRAPEQSPPPGGMVKLYSPSEASLCGGPLQGGMVKLYSPSGADSACCVNCSAKCSAELVSATGARTSLRSTQMPQGMVG